MKLEHSLTPYTKINSKWFKDLNINHDTTKLLEENIDKILSDINHGNMFLDQPPKGKEIKAKINKWDLTKLKRFWTAKKKKPINKRKVILWSDKKNICSPCNWQRVIIQNIQTAHATQYLKSKQPKQKMCRWPSQTYFQRRHTDGQQKHKKMLNITRYKRNAN